MAEINTSGTHSKRGGIRSKKLSTRVDLTPMVDLGFLLITFFIFTTTMQQSNAMKLIVPDDRDVKNPTTTAAKAAAVSDGQCCSAFISAEPQADLSPHAESVRSSHSQHWVPWPKPPSKNLEWIANHDRRILTNNQPPRK